MDYKLHYDTLVGKLYVGKNPIIKKNVDFLAFWEKENPLCLGTEFYVMTLVLTSQCNLRCTYCWELPILNKKTNSMSKKTLDKWLRFFLSQGLSREKKITYYGGEPLIRADLIEYSAKKINEFCQRKNIPKPKQHIFTNGTLINEKTTKLFKKNNIFPVISLDGNEIANNSRVDILRRPAFSRIIKGIKKLQDEKIAFGIACTTPNLTSDAEEIANFIINKLKPTSVEFNLRHDKQMARLYSTGKRANFRGLNKAWDLSISKKIRVIDLAKRVDALIEQKPLRSVCSGCKHKLAIMPNGKISPFSGAIALPRLQINPPKNENSVVEWIEPFTKLWGRELRNQSKCKTCPAIFVCGQGCGFSSILQYGDINHIPAYHCEYTKYMFDYILKKIKRNIKLRGQEIREIKPCEIARIFDWNQPN